jgi:hypothetical protein
VPPAKSSSREAHLAGAPRRVPIGKTAAMPRRPPTVIGKPGEVCLRRAGRVELTARDRYCRPRTDDAGSYEATVEKAGPDPGQRDGRRRNHKAEGGRRQKDRRRREDDRRRYCSANYRPVRRRRG